MKTGLWFTVIILTVLNCEQKVENTFKIHSEPLTTIAEAKTKSWIGYHNFSYEIEDVSSNFSKSKLIEKTDKLLSNAHSMLYSMPNDLRTEDITEAVSAVLEKCKVLGDSIKNKSEEALKSEFKEVVDLYRLVNREINSHVEN